MQTQKEIKYNKKVASQTPGAKSKSVIVDFSIPKDIKGFLINVARTTGWPLGTRHRSVSYII